MSKGPTKDSCRIFGTYKLGDILPSIKCSVYDLIEIFNIAL